MDTDQPVPPPLPPKVVRVRTSGLAIAAFVVSLVSICCFPGELIALVLAVVALRNIRRSAGQLTGRGLAVAAIVIAIVGLILGSVFVWWMTSTYNEITPIVKQKIHLLTEGDVDAALELFVPNVLTDDHRRPFEDLSRRMPALGELERLSWGWSLQINTTTEGIHCTVVHRGRFANDDNVTITSVFRRFNGEWRLVGFWMKSPLVMQPPALESTAPM